MSAALPISGTRVPLRHGAYAAEIASVGASLRSLTFDGRDLVVPFAEDELRPLYRGVTLAPWPNRVVDGRYTFDGATYQLPINEVDRGHALHGLVTWSDFRVVARTTEAVTLDTAVVAQGGYPFPLRVEVEHRLTDDGLATRIATTNTGAVRAPYGASGHPYLVGGPGRVDDWSLELAADEVLEVDAERLIPQGVGPVGSGPFDFAEARRIGDLFIDHAFTGLRAHRARVVAADGRGAELRWDAVAPWVQVHTGDRPEPEYHRAGLAVEPMTCPPDAFNSCTDLVVLEPGETHTLTWTIAAI